MPGDVINLRLKRKAMKRQRDREAADRNAVVHGLPKKVTRLADARREKADRDLGAHRMERDAPEDA
ncbi:MAG: DUF4169 family protein [Pseudomonadota bacterium]